MTDEFEYISFFSAVHSNFLALKENCIEDMSTSPWEIWNDMMYMTTIQDHPEFNVKRGYMFIESMFTAFHLNDNQRQTLSAWNNLNIDFSGLSFKYANENCNIDFDVMKKCIKELSYMGILKYMSGMVTEDGEFYGSGYHLTPLGYYVKESLGFD